MPGRTADLRRVVDLVERPSDAVRPDFTVTV